MTIYPHHSSASPEHPLPPSAAGPARPRRGPGFWLLAFLVILLGGSVLLNLLLLVSSSAGSLLGGGSLSLLSVRKFEEEVVKGTGPKKILLLPITGELTEGGSEMFGRRETGTVEQVRAVLEQAEADPNLLAVILEIDSPGGSVTASDRLYHELKTFRERTGKFLLAHFSDTAASGAYYLAMGTDHIMASPTGITGSIGVIFSGMHLQGLLAKLGVKMKTIKSGPLKDMGSSFRPWTPEETRLFQEIIDQLYGRFVKIVGEGRKGLSADEIRVLADGRIYTADQALAAKLIDSIGYDHEALELVTKKLNLRDPSVVRYHRPPRLLDLFSMTAARLNPWAGAPALSRRQGFFYLWAPGE